MKSGDEPDTEQGQAGMELDGEMDLRRWSAWSLPPDLRNAQEEKVLEQGEQMMASAEGSSGRTSPPSLHNDPEELDSARQEEPGPAAEALETSDHLAQLQSGTTLSGLGSTIWTTGSSISHWRLAHQRGYQRGHQLTQGKFSGSGPRAGPLGSSTLCSSTASPNESRLLAEPLLFGGDPAGGDVQPPPTQPALSKPNQSYRHRLRKHERDCKAVVPLPLLGLMQEEVLAILTETLKDYRRQLGARHPLTHHMEQRMEQLRQQLGARSTGSGGAGQMGPHPCVPMSPQTPLHPTPSP